MSSSSRIIIVSNRLPVTVAQEGGRLVAKRSVGGLATALAPVVQQRDTLWVGWAGMRRSLKSHEISQLQLPDYLVPVDLTASLVRRYYDRAANGTICPCLLNFIPQHPCDELDWQAYVGATRRFARTIRAICRPDDLIWIHDYHLMLLPQMLRETGVYNRTGFFLHTSFPELDFLRQVPNHKDIISSLAAADVVGLQTKRDVTRFLDAHSAIRPLASINAKVRDFPIGVDYEMHNTTADLPEVRALIADAGSTGRLKGKRVIFSVSRLDYVKGLITQLEAVEKLLDNLSATKREQLVYKLVVAPSRESMSEYRALRHDIQRTVDRINNRFRTDNWQPVDYDYRAYGFHEVMAWYHLADICLVAPWADGMNLVAKEYVAARQDDAGMLVLSESIGAAVQLKHAVLVDPVDPGAVAAGLARALDMPPTERELRWYGMRAAIKEQDVFWWTEQFLAELTEIDREIATFAGAI